MIITLQGIKKDFGIKEIIRNGDLSIDYGDKVGLIGVNGSGKSTLLKMIAGLEPMDGGNRQVRSGTKLVYLPQQPQIDPDRTVLEQIFADCGEQMNLIKEYELLSQKIAQGDITVMTKLSQITEQIERIGGWELETQAKIILNKLGITDFHGRVGDLSGGYRKRIALATALMAQPDLLLMDEPTNHLDAVSVEWLQEYLQKFRGAILLITHDRYFLDQVTNRILELDRGDLFSYQGNYSYYLAKKAEAEESIASSQRKHKGILRRELEWLSRGPKARSTKQKARIDRVRELQNQEFKQAQNKVAIDTPGRRIGKKVISLHHVSKSFNDRVLIKDFSYEFTPLDRVGIIGGNGTGKSTLLNLITNRLEPDQGKVEIGSTIHIGYFDQHSEDLLTEKHQAQRVIDYIKEVGELVKTSDGNTITASQMLEKFLFLPNQQYAPISKLSGGEKRRLFLLKILMEAPNVLILDEPTNDLDVQTLSVLEEYLEDFNGCVITVSHDRYFLDRTVDFIFAIEKEGNVKQYPGNYSVYLDAKRSELPETPKVEVSPVKTSSKPPTKPRRLTNYQRKELEQLEQQISILETEKAELENRLYNHPPSGYSQIQAMTIELEKLNQAIETATERWLELAELAE
jgi:ATP-binding cassette subfamily F protein uup